MLRFFNDVDDPPIGVELDDAKPFLAKGPTGVCVRTFAKLAQSWR